MVNRRGFTLIELMVVIAIIGVLMGFLLPAIANARKNARVGQANNAIKTIVMALEAYRQDFRKYPPNDDLGKHGAPTGDQAGSEIIAYYLCSRHTWGDMHYGPYLDLPEDRFKETGGTAQRELVSPINGGYYKYVLMREADGSRRNYLIIDPGFDGKFGGDVDESQGFVSDGGTESKDNLYSSMTGRASADGSSAPK